MADYSVKEFLKAAVALGAMTPGQVKQAVDAYHAARGKRPFDAILREDIRLTSADMKRVVAALKGGGPGEGTEIIRKTVADLKDDTGSESGTEILRPKSPSSRIRRASLEKFHAPEPSAAPKPARNLGPWIAVTAVMAVVGGGVAFLATRPIDKPAAPAADPAAPTSKSSGPVTEKTSTPADSGKGPAELNTGTAIASEWNQLAREMRRRPGQDIDARLLGRAQDLLNRARGTADEPILRDQVARMLASVKGAACDEFEFYRAKAAKLCERGRFGDAWDSWEWFPTSLDQTDVFNRQIKFEQQAIVDAAKKYYDDVATRVAALEAGGKFEEAKLLLLSTLLMGDAGPVKAILDEARKRLDELTRKEEKAIHDAELAHLREFDAREKERLEAAARAEEKRARVWALVLQRNLEGARVVLKGEVAKEQSNPDMLVRLRVLESVLDGVDGMYAAVEKSLAAKSGEERSFAFVTGTIKGKIGRIEPKRVTMKVDGRDLTQRIIDLDFKELPALVEASKFKGLALLLAEAPDAALAEFEKAKDDALAGFVRQSPALLAKNADEMMKRAGALADAGDFEKAAELYTTLSLVPEKKWDAILRRGECYYQMSLFPAAMLDVEQLFAAGKISRGAIELLNNTFERAALVVKAVELYEAALKADPKNDRVAAALLGLYVKTHRYTDADTLINSLTREARFNARFGELVGVMRRSRDGFKGKQTAVAPFGRYVVETNAGQEPAQKWAEEMDAIYKEYFKVFPYSKNETLHFYVKIFEKEYDFRTYLNANEVGKTYRIEGFYEDTVKELVLYKCEGMHQTMRHEGFHQYLDFFVNNCPCWFNEGYASYFETSTADGPVYNPERAREARDGLGGNLVPPLKDLLMMSNGAWHAHKYGAHLYGESWSFIYYLTKTGRKKILDDYFTELMRGRSQRQAYDAVFGTLDMAALEKAWREAVLKDAIRN